MTTTIPAGWKLVPIEPTREMWAAVNKLDNEMAAGGYDGRGASIEQVWNCLVSAAPACPTCGGHGMVGGWVRTGHDAAEYDAEPCPDCAAPGVSTVEDVQAWPSGLLDRVKAAEKRIRDGHGLMRVPADPTDPDLVLAEIAALIEGRKPPFWLRPAPAAGDALDVAPEFAIPLRVAQLIRGAYLPSNLRKLRRVHPDVVAALETYLDALADAAIEAQRKGDA